MMMLRAISIVSLAATLAGCDAVINPCYVKHKDELGTVLSYVGDRACLRLSAPVEMEGLWRNQFEGSEFKEGAHDPVEFGIDGKRTWLNDEELLRGPPSNLVPEQTYRVRLIGRRPSWSWSRAMKSGFGHLGMSDDLVVVDEFISLDPITDPALHRPQPSTTD